MSGYNQYGFGGGYSPNYRNPLQDGGGHKSSSGHKGAFGSAQKSLAKKILKWVAVVLASLLILLWFFLGRFSFMIPHAFSLSGFPFGTRNYIVLFQNNYELRPTGGFISTYGLLKFSHGIYKGIEFHDVYGEIDEHEYVEPPLVLAALLKGEGYKGHNFRDANFDPDFTKSKDEIINFYNMVFPDTRIDGVIAGDFTLLENMVALYEPLKVEDYEFTKANLFETLSTVVSDIDRHSEEALKNRKNISAEIVKKIIAKTLILPWRINSVLDTLARALDEKHLLASFTRSGLANAFAKRDWDGALPGSKSGDFVAVSDANYGGMKSNRYITRDVSYELNVSGAEDILGNPIVTAKVTIQIKHNGIWNIPLSGPYTGYLRTLIPLGSDVKAGGTVNEVREDAMVLGQLLEIPVGGEATYTYEYQLPEYVWVDGVYSLRLQKQPGTLADHYRVIVKAPQGQSIESPYFDVRENVAFYETNLLTDQNLSFTLLPDKNSPRIVSHEITALNEITIVFNEQVSVDFAGDSLNYQITDMNFTHPTASDTIQITNIRVDGSAVIISTEGMTDQPEERYEVVLKNIRDLAGNLITPSPRTVTVIQDAHAEAESGGATSNDTES